jgi:hypothetical protein
MLSPNGSPAVQQSAKRLVANRHFESQAMGFCHAIAIVRGRRER